MVSKKELRKLFKLARKMARWMEHNGVGHADMYAFGPDENDNLSDAYRDKWYIGVTAHNGDERVVDISKFLTEDEL